ncbi:uncharacterized protein LOC62_04G005252 [Vanrija pseudolonga]|uniref:Uncharacterized protein n=1 Tax=Vanrija pseudolonga TaxID=143232 RepID=A0AAF1BI01_9TREE|nr:hypothetical protein LOC62_04G005252 [Vanrija pseudolonga]
MPLPHWPLPRSDMVPSPPVRIRVDAPAGSAPFHFGRARKCSCSSDGGGDHSPCFHRTADAPNPAAPRVTIDHTYFPEIMDNILRHCSNTALANFRGTGKAFNRRISKELLRHINLKSMYVGGGSGQKFYLFGLDAPGGSWANGMPSRELALPAAEECVRTIDLSRINKRGNQDAPSILNECAPLDFTIVFPELQTVRRINSTQSFRLENSLAVTLVDFFSQPFILNASEYGDITEHIIHLSDTAIHGMEFIDYARLGGTLKRITLVIGDVPAHEPASPTDDDPCEHCQNFVNSVEDIVIGALEALVRGASVTIVGLELLQCPVSYEVEDDDLTVKAINIQRIKQSVAEMFGRYPGVKTDYVMKQIRFKKSADWWRSPAAKVMYPLPDYLNYT